MANRVDALERLDPASAPVVRVLEPDHAGPDVVNVVGAYGVLEVVERKQAEVPLERPGRHSRVPGDTPGLPNINMRGAGAEELITGPRVHPDCDLVGHRPGGNEHRGLLAQKLGRAGLQRLHRRVIAEHVVANLGLRHRPAHGRRRARHRVGPQVDRRSVHEVVSKILPGDPRSQAVILQRPGGVLNPVEHPGQPVPYLRDREAVRNVAFRAPEGRQPK